MSVKTSIGEGVTSICEWMFMPSFLNSSKSDSLTVYFMPKRSLISNFMKDEKLFFMGADGKI